MRFPCLCFFISFFFLFFSLPDSLFGQLSHSSSSGAPKYRRSAGTSQRGVSRLISIREAANASGRSQGRAGNRPGRGEAEPELIRPAEKRSGVGACIRQEARIDGTCPDRSLPPRRLATEIPDGSGKGNSAGWGTAGGRGTGGSPREPRLSSGESLSGAGRI